MTTEYHEDARSYRSLLPLAALFVALFLLDVSLGGAEAHLIGWLIAAVLVIGTWALIVHAARVSHSLTLTADDVRVGEETIRRGAIVSAEPGVDGELPVLGWPLGRAPRRIRAGGASGGRRGRVRPVPVPEPVGRRPRSRAG